MYRPNKGISGVLLNDSLLNFRLIDAQCYCSASVFSKLKRNSKVMYVANIEIHCKLTMYIVHIVNMPCK